MRFIPPALLALVLLSSCLSSFAPAQYAGAEIVPDAVRRGFASIKEEDCRSWLSVLAGDEFEGRGTGSPGYQKAADFMAAKFKSFGLKPGGEKGSWFQQVPFKRARLLTESSFCVLPDGRTRLTAGRDVTFFPAEAELEAPVVFLHARGVKARLKERKAIRGKIVIAFGVADTNRQLRFRLAARGVALLRVVEKVTPPRLEPVRRGSRRIVGEITIAAARRLAEALGVPEAVQDPGVAENEVKVIPGGDGKLKIRVESEIKSIGVPNVVAMLPGSDPELRHEFVVIGSHLDHLGKRGGTIFYGADDDGSGSTALLSVARAFARNGKAPRRSILFLAFCGEELGLVGSRYYTDHPLHPLENVVCELQLDMVGRNEENKRRGERPEENVMTTHLIGSKRLSTELHDLIIDQNRYVGFTFEYDEEDVYTRSDHYMFARKGIPVAFFFSGFHPDYHRPTDTVDKINFEKLANHARLVFLVAHAAADRKQRLTVDKKR